MRERRVGAKIWEFHFSSLAILAHPPTTFAEHTEPWMEGRAERRLPLTHPPTTRKFLGAITRRGGRDPAFMVNLFENGNAELSLVQWGLCGRRWTTRAPLRDQAFTADFRAERGQREHSRRRINRQHARDVLPLERATVGVMELTPFSSPVFHVWVYFTVRHHDELDLLWQKCNDCEYVIYLHFAVACLPW